MDNSEVFQHIEFFRQLSAEKQEEFVLLSKENRLDQGQFLVNFIRFDTNVIFILDGRLRVYQNSESGREITLYHVEPGQTCVLNLMAVLSDRFFDVNFQSVKDTRLIIIPGFAIRDWISNEPLLQNYIFELIADRIIRLMMLMNDVVFNRMDKRLFNFLMNQFSEKTTINLTHDQIASELGTAREVVSRLLQDLVSRGAIDTGRSQIFLKDRNILTQLCKIEVW